MARIRFGHPLAQRADERIKAWRGQTTVTRFARSTTCYVRASCATDHAKTMDAIVQLETGQLGTQDLTPILLTFSSVVPWQRELIRTSPGQAPIAQRPNACGSAIGLSEVSRPFIPPQCHDEFRRLSTRSFIREGRSTYT